MKCIRCYKDCTYKERSDKKCPHCRGAFGLEPRSGDIMSDAAMEGAVKAVSAEGKVRWNLDNLYYEVCRRQKRSNSSCGWGCLLAADLALFPNSPSLALGLGGLLGLGYFFRSQKPPALLSPQVFNQAWSRWAAAHGTPPSLIVPKAARKSDPAAEKDLGDYSFDRAVICDQSKTVDLLLANNFHFENNCAVLTMEGYPPQAFATVKAMLAKNPRLRVWVLHDATPSGCRLARRVRESGWFAETAEIIDVGLRPGQLAPLKKLWEPAPGPVEADPQFSAEERKWFASNVLYLAAIRPEQTIKRLFRSMSTFKTESGGSSDGGGAGFYTDSSSFSADASTSDGGGDSFG